MRFTSLSFEGGKVVEREVPDWEDRIKAAWRSHFDRMATDPEYAERMRREAERDA